MTTETTPTPEKEKPIRYVPSEDGETHINVYSKGRTELGQLLSNFAHCNFKHPDDGHFSSVEGYWYWLKTGCKHQELRRLYGMSAKLMGSKKPVVEIDQETFREKIKAAIKAKISQSRTLYRLFIKSTLPLTHYYTYGRGDEVVRYKDEHKWITDYLTELRAQWQKPKEKPSE